MKPSHAQKYILFLFSEFICIGGWEEFTPTIVIDYPIHSASSYNDYSGYNFYEVSINSGKVHSFLKQCFKNEWILAITLETVSYLNNNVHLI